MNDYTSMTSRSLQSQMLKGDKAAQREHDRRAVRTIAKRFDQSPLSTDFLAIAFVIFALTLFALI